MTDGLAIVTLTDLARIGCDPTTPMRELLARLNASTDLFQLVVDGDGRLLGTITDGDVRRALLSGAAMEDPVSRFMNASPMAGRAGDLADARRRLGSIKSLVPFLPIVDADGKLVSVLVQRRIDEDHPVALIMAGGRGTRLGERTRQTPKPLIQVRGKPMLEHVLGLIEGAGIRDVYVSVHYLADQIDRFCSQRQGEARITILREDAPFGTAGALALIPDHVDNPVLVMNGDLVTDVDLTAMKDLHRHHGWDATIAVARHEFEIPYGVVRADENARFLGIEEKPKMRHFVSAGIYLLNERLRRLVPKGRRIDMPELFETGRAAGLRIGVFPLHENWRDVGRPADLDAANGERPGGS